MQGAEQRSAFPLPNSGEPQRQYGPENRWASPALQNAERWLIAHGAIPSVAQSVPQDIWVFGAYHVEPTMGRAFPIGIAAQQFPVPDGNSIRISLYLPYERGIVSDNEQLRRLYTLATVRFVTFRDSLTASRSRVYTPGAPVVLPVMDLVKINSQDEFEADVQSIAHQEQSDFLGIYTEDLRGDLSLMMEPETVDAWLDRPNVTLGEGVAPRELLTTGNDRGIRDLIRAYRRRTHNL